MSAYINSAVLLGNLCTEVELRYAKNTGEPVAQFRLAVGSQDKVCFIPVVVFGKQAENAARYLGKGASCSVEGSIQMLTWQDKETGKNRTSYNIAAHRIQYVGSRNDAGAQPEQKPDSAGNQAVHRHGRDEIPESMRQQNAARVENPDDDIPF